MLLFGFNFGVIISRTHTHTLCFHPEVVCEERCLDCESGQEGNNRSTVLRVRLAAVTLFLHGGTPSAFGSAGLGAQACGCWSLTRCAHSACCSSGLRGAAIIPQ